ncbi:hypothetical protein Q5H93_17660 [Hymenobacter sp. ASUV-10]|uniref:Uncharacterized protein n=1 Tax=Hymenobacter aranciens TaxID=3063996 RepID=A0ABT9BE73_9BACT|nr:hypothetical protein [Hymenobacter sp. ASUV-10]MDO7876576.1 hypothetical protein [Hymenobacter sp. ASUV-10]
MKQFYLTAALAAAVLTPVCAQTTPVPQTLTASAAVPVAAAAPADEEAPHYAGFYINGKQVKEINCYGFDEMTLVYPFFNSLDMCDHFRVNIIAGSYDLKNKLQLEYVDRTEYSRADVENIRAKFAGKGYGTITRTGLIEKFNQDRGTRPGELYEGNSEKGSPGMLKYLEMDPAKVGKSVIFFEIITSVFAGTYSDQGDPQFRGSLVYTSPKIPLTGRVSTASIGLKASATKKGLAFVPLVGVVANAVKEKPLPELQNENCALPSNAVTLPQAKKVLRDEIGEEISTN